MAVSSSLCLWAEEKKFEVVYIVLALLSAFALHLFDVVYLIAGWVIYIKVAYETKNKIVSATLFFIFWLNMSYYGGEYFNFEGLSMMVSVILVGVALWHIFGTVKVK